MIPGRSARWESYHENRMESMSTTTQVQVEEYLRRTEKPNAEYIDGAVHPKDMPTPLHSLIQYLLCLLLRTQGAQALPELTVRLSPTKFLVPDVAVVGKFEASYPTEPVLLCAEILSPENRVGSILAKCEQYHTWGVPFCWVIDPAKQNGWEYHAGGEPLRVDRSGVLHAGELAVSVADLFSEIPLQQIVR
jgi:Uma2 family endonuclease